MLIPDTPMPKFPTESSLKNENQNNTNLENPNGFIKHQKINIFQILEKSTQENFEHNVFKVNLQENQYHYE